MRRAASPTLLPFEFASEGPAVPGASRVVNLTYMGFGGIRAYRDSKDTAWFVMADLLKALGSGSTRSGRMRQRLRDAGELTKVRVWVVNTVHAHASGYRVIDALSECGIFMVWGLSHLADRQEFCKWIKARAIPILDHALGSPA